MQEEGSLRWWNLEGGTPPAPVLILDLDGTLVWPASKRVHPKDADDWQFTPRGLEGAEEREDGLTVLCRLLRSYTVAIVTNQSGQEFRLLRLAHILRAANKRITTELQDWRLLLFAATAGDRWRKPHTTIAEEHILPRMPPDQEELIVIGDAAGRPADFSDSDRSFAHNLQLVVRKGVRVLFSTPEEYFWGAPHQTRKWRLPSSLVLAQQEEGRTCDARTPEELDGLRFVRALVLVGPPGSGKSTLSAALATLGWHRLCLDTLGTKTKCLRALSAFLAEHAEGKVVFDCTSPSRTARALFYDALCQERILGVNVAVVHLVLDPLFCQHLQLYRERVGGPPRVPLVGVRSYYKRFEAPSPSEWHSYPHQVVRYGWTPQALQARYFRQRLLSESTALSGNPGKEGPSA